MPLPISFLLGLVWLLGVETLGDDLPRAADGAAMLPYLLLLPLPWAVARYGRRPAAGPEPGSRWERLGRLGRDAVPLLLPPVVFGLLVGPGEMYRTVAAATDSAFVETGLLIAPLAGMVITAELGALQALRRAQFVPAGDRALIPPPFRSIMVGFLALPLLGFAGGLDVLSLHRELEVFCLGTGLGNLLGFLTFVVLMSALMPLLFRLLFPASRTLPADVRATAARLGFPPRALFQMRSNLTMINAALVGPIPGLRFLFLTDGLLRVLDPFSLRGVVAHEVGHARGGHPLWLFLLFLVVPLLLMQPLELLAPAGLGEIEQLALAVCLAVVGGWVLHRVAHRFELEADQLSAEALGGATPCFLALHKIGELYGGARTRSSFFHPSEERRLDLLLRCESDRGYLARFRWRGRVLRGGILLLLGLSILANGLAQRQAWPVDAAVVALYSGRFADAKRALDALPEEPASRADEARRLAEEAGAALQLYPDGGAWREIREDLAARALERGRAELVRAGAVAARPWFALGTVKAAPTPLELSLYRYCSARAHENEARATRFRDHLLAEFVLEPDLRSAVASGL